MSLPAAAVALLMTGPALPEGAGYVVEGQIVATDADLQPGTFIPVIIPMAAQVSAQSGLPAGPEAPAGQDSPSGSVQLPQTANPADSVPAQPPATQLPDGTAVAPPSAPAPGQPESEIVVTAPQPPPPGDPLERINVESFKAVQAVDKAVLEPVAKAYNKGLPRPVRQGLRNFFTNLSEPVVFVAYLLQLKPGKAAETAGRFAINTTLGVAGLVDVAKKKPFNLPYRPNGLANTLGYYGVGPGPFMYLPIVGPTTLRDIIGDTVDRLLLPAAVGKPFTNPEVVLPMTIVDQLGERAAFDERINKIREEDRPYAAYRELYLKQRQAEIDALHGRITPDVVPVDGPSMKTFDKNDQTKSPEDGAAPTGSDAPVESQPAPVQPEPAPTPEPVQIQPEPVPAN